MSLIADRLAAVRSLMSERGYDALVIPRADEYLGEYLPEHNERMLWMAGFTGSAGAIVVLAERAAIFVDGRYTVQVRNEVDPDLFEYHHLIEEPPVAWLTTVLGEGSQVACDPRLHTLAWYQHSDQHLAAKGITLVADADNIVDRCWQDRPAAAISPAVMLDEAYTGASSAQKRSDIAELVRVKGADAALIFAPDSVSWLLNLRGTDIPCLPILQSFALLAVDGTCQVFAEPGRVPDGWEQHVGTGVTFVPESEAEAALLGCAGMRVLADPDSANAWTQLCLARGGAELVAAEDPVLMPKASKNSVEIEGARQAHLRDAVAEIQFLQWLDAEVAAGNLHDEAVLADKLGSFREQGEHYRGPSFDTISAAGGNAAMCHYNHQNVEQPGFLTPDSVYLVDSGGQYLDGTTDITRTVAIGDPGPEVRRMFTLVLKGHIALDQARFPRGTTGTHLDALARQFLWREGHDFDHGTGHGVGAYLSVHEGPQRIAKAHNPFPLQPGMILSNEPGYYRDNAYGIRCENLVVVQPVDADTEVPMLGFEALTMVPFDRRLLDVSLLTVEELDWLNRYHQQVFTLIAPRLEGDVLAWLEDATAPVAA
ncbi:X-Pro aminopeptidase [Halioglobus sp. HI00S01]|uniref:aminopeptidase P family protein n=2 Tax=Halioglobus sp. HI00S01 TaxID=1822214 RepID=UPI0007C212FC|nr:aminopeptidase P family protein [Halioglobus sp. HI00S01]KZX59456.1 X-Pro aminopeptidase [Halioglobus sp. HI00S01]